MKSSKRNSKKSRRNGVSSKKNSLRSKTDPALLLRTEYPGQPACTLMMQSIAGLLTTTVTTGLIAIASQISTSGIQNFATRFAGFEQWRIVKSTLVISFFSSNNAGQLSFWAESDTGAPTSSDAAEIRAKRVNVSDVTKLHTLTYIPHDVLEQSWTDVGTNFTCGTWKIYTDTATYGAPSVVTNLGNYQWNAIVQLRGYR